MNRRPTSPTGRPTAHVESKGLATCVVHQKVLTNLCASHGGLS